ncbi:glycosyltransferase family 4 protein [Synechococcus sp. HJ21-Hayes]|uniref:glycosyltransferase family 4 protein n=1 Tax=unclassified Synechococcus TaxID=2626047 RepID=UPI0020CEFE52|nr:MULTISPECIES: glycosyltransferase family 4 protein [unclassified Synechococcus]MCP9832600.1 glycosyltransferase family 4 protein [Synechococcus sp. JJ3a-Johnson]MCP9852083.1 glycosyltransferase family 4 protein [Synechococcus sp. HJ21-Hayes]
MRLLAIHTHPVQYVAPQFRWLAAHTSLEVLYLCRQNFSPAGQQPDPGFGQPLCWDQPLLEGYASAFLTEGGLAAIEGLQGLRLLPAVLRWVHRSRPDAVLLFNHAPWLVGGLAGLLPRLGIPLLLRTEATDAVRLRTPGLALLRDLGLRWIYRRSALVCPISGHGRRHLEVRCVPPERICLASYAPDTTWLEAQRRQWQPQAAAQRQRIGIPDQAPVLLYAGRLAEEKDVLLIAVALALLPLEERRTLHLISVGSGPLESEWNRRLSALLGDHFHPLGFLNQGEIGRAYAMADALVLPSRHSETWGLVVHEALAFGCQALLSHRVGCARDLLALGQPIRCFPAGHAPGLAAVLRQWLTDPHAAPVEPCADLPDVLDFPKALLAALQARRL